MEDSVENDLNLQKERISRVNKNGTNEASNLREKGLLMSDSIDQTVRCSFLLYFLLWIQFLYVKIVEIHEAFEKPVPKKNEPLRFWMEVEAELRKNGNSKCIFFPSSRPSSTISVFVQFSSLRETAHYIPQPYSACFSLKAAANDEGSRPISTS